MLAHFGKKVVKAHGLLDGTGVLPHLLFLCAERGVGVACEPPAQGICPATKNKSADYKRQGVLLC